MLTMLEPIPKPSFDAEAGKNISPGWHSVTPATSPD